MKSADAALIGGVLGSMTVEGVSSLSEGGGRTGMAGDGADDHNGGLETVMVFLSFLPSSYRLIISPSTYGYHVTRLPM